MHPDGEALVVTSYQSGAADLYLLSLGQPDTLALLLQDEARLYPSSWSPTGDRFAYMRADAETGNDIWVLPIGAEPVPFRRTEANENHARFSPDGQWLAYGSDESGSPEVYVARYPEGGDLEKVSSGGGTEPLWQSDGDELFYRDGNRIMVVAVSWTDGSPSFGVPQHLFDFRFGYRTNDAVSSYDVSPDGQRFVAIGTEPLPPRRLYVVVNLEGGRR